MPTVTGVINGSAIVNSQLTLNVGGSAPPSAAYSYQWYSCAANTGTYAAIAGATTNSYKTTVNEYGKYLKCIITTTSPAYNNITTNSNIVGPVNTGVLTGPVTLNNTNPSLSDNGGSIITATTSITCPGGSVGTPQWYRNGIPISGANKWSYTIIETDIGNTLSCQVTSGNAYYTGTIKSGNTNAVTDNRPYAILYSDGLLEFQRGKTPTTGKTVIYSYTRIETTNYLTRESVPWNEQRSNIKSVNFKDNIAPISTAHWFYNIKAITINNLTKLNTAKVTNMSNMFYICSSLTSLDVTNFDTVNVTNMQYMFSYCSSLVSVGLPVDIASSPAVMTGANEESYGISKMFSGDQKLKDAGQIPAWYVGTYATV